MYLRTCYCLRTLSLPLSVLPYRPTQVVIAHNNTSLTHLLIETFMLTQLLLGTYLYHYTIPSPPLSLCYSFTGKLLLHLSLSLTPSLTLSTYTTIIFSLSLSLSLSLSVLIQQQFSLTLCRIFDQNIFFCVKHSQQRRLDLQIRVENPHTPSYSISSQPSQLSVALSNQRTISFFFSYMYFYLFQ